jgi:hypothetical protein
MIAAIALGLLGLSGAGYGQEEKPTLDPVMAEPVVTPDVLTIRDKSVLDKDVPAKTDITLDLQTRFGWGVGLLGPLGAAGRVSLLHGLGADVRDDETRVKAVCAVPIPHCAKGFLIQADAGTGGGKLSLGLGAYAKVREESFKGTAGVAFRLAVARTWGDPIGTEPGLTYVGPELDLSIIRINLTLGVLFRVSGDRGSSALFSWGVGFGS